MNPQQRLVDLERGYTKLFINEDFEKINIDDILLDQTYIELKSVDKLQMTPHSILKKYPLFCFLFKELKMIEQYLSFLSENKCLRTLEPYIKIEQTIILANVLYQEQGMTTNFCFALARFVKVMEYFDTLFDNQLKVSQFQSRGSYNNKDAAADDNNNQQIIISITKNAKYKQQQQIKDFVQKFFEMGYQYLDVLDVQTIAKEERDHYTIIKSKIQSFIQNKMPNQFQNTLDQKELQNSIMETLSPFLASQQEISQSFSSNEGNIKYVKKYSQDSNISQLELDQMSSVNQSRKNTLINNSKIANSVSHDVIGNQQEFQDQSIPNLHSNLLQKLNRKESQNLSPKSNRKRRDAIIINQKIISQKSEANLNMIQLQQLNEDRKETPSAAKQEESIFSTTNQRKKVNRNPIKKLTNRIYNMFSSNQQKEVQPPQNDSNKGQDEKQSPVLKQTGFINGIVFHKREELEKKMNVTLTATQTNRSGKRSFKFIDPEQNIQLMNMHQYLISEKSDQINRTRKESTLQWLSKNQDGQDPQYESDENQIENVDDEQNIYADSLNFNIKQRKKLLSQIYGKTSQEKDSYMLKALNQKRIDKIMMHQNQSENDFSSSNSDSNDLESSFGSSSSSEEVKIIHSIKYLKSNQAEIAYQEIYFPHPRESIEYCSCLKQHRYSKKQIKPLQKKKNLLAAIYDEPETPYKNRNMWQKLRKQFQVYRFFKQRFKASYNLINNKLQSDTLKVQVIPKFWIFVNYIREIVLQKQSEKKTLQNEFISQIKQVQTQQGSNILLINRNEMNAKKTQKLKSRNNYLINFTDTQI